MCKESKCNCLCGLFGMFSLSKKNSNHGNYEKITDPVSQQDLQQAIEKKYEFDSTKLTPHNLKYKDHMKIVIPSEKYLGFNNFLIAKDIIIGLVNGSTYYFDNENADKLLDNLTLNKNLDYQIN